MKFACRTQAFMSRSGQPQQQDHQITFLYRHRGLSEGKPSAFALLALGPIIQQPAHTHWKHIDLAFYYSAFGQALWIGIRACRLCADLAENPSFLECFLGGELWSTEPL